MRLYIHEVCPQHTGGRYPVITVHGSRSCLMNEPSSSTTNKAFLSSKSRLGVPLMTYMTIFELRCCVWSPWWRWGNPSPTEMDQKLTSPTGNNRFFLNTITGTRYFSTSDNFWEEIFRNNRVINMESTTYTRMSGLEHRVMATSREDIIIFLYIYYNIYIYTASCISMSYCL